MATARAEVAALLARVGRSDLAAMADAELPDPVEMDELDRFGQRHGLTRDWLISRMGGSP